METKIGTENEDKNKELTVCQVFWQQLSKMQMAPGTQKKPLLIS